MWYVRNGEKNGVIGTNGQFAIPMEYKNIWIHTQNGITVAKADNSQSRYDYDGTLLDAFVFDEVYHLSYFINEFDKDGNQKQAIDETMLKYSANNFYGLMSKKGIPITPPIYAEIETITPGVYQCKIPESYECIAINSEGKKIND